MLGSDLDVPRTPEAVRLRLARLIKVAASAGHFSPKLAEAVKQATDEEVQVMNDLVERGMAIPDLVGVLQGAHVVVGDEDLYERWIFAKSRRRLSSHHRLIDKTKHPDYGLDGPLVRESLHGKAPAGTWVQLERTKASFRWGRVPTWTDLVHIRDYVIYLITGKNVGPWGLSAHVDTRPMLLRPPNTTTGNAVDHGLAAFTQRRSTAGYSEATASRWSDLLTMQTVRVGPVGDLFDRPVVPRARELLPDAPYKDDLGPGLFGTLAIVTSRVGLPAGVASRLDRGTPEIGFEPREGAVQALEVKVGRTSVSIAGIVSGRPHRPVGFGIEEAV